MAKTLPSDTRAAVREVADQLLTEGIKPSVKLVRQRLGRGSDTTIASALKDWWQELAERLFEQQHRPEVPEPVWEVASGLWDAALDAAGQTFSGDRERLEKARNESLDKRDAALLARDQATDEVAGLREELEAAQAALADERQRLAAESARVGELRQQLRAAEKAVTEATDRAAARIDEYRGQLELAEHRYDRLEQRSAKEIDSARQERDHLQKELAGERASFEKNERKLSDQVSEVRELLARTEQRASSSETSLREHKDENRQLREHSQVLSIEVQNLRAESEREIAIKTELDKELGQTRDELQEPKQRLAAAEALLKDRQPKRRRDKQ